LDNSLYPEQYGLRPRLLRYGYGRRNELDGGGGHLNRQRKINKTSILDEINFLLWITFDYQSRSA